MLGLVDSDRFNSKWIPEPNSGCWLWEAGLDSSGYGNFCYKGRSLGAHRVSYLHYVGEVPEGLQVLHSCDTRCCVNPNHLFTGSLQDNMEDRNNKGRQARLKGSSNGFSKLNEDQVIDIFTRYNGVDNTITSLGKEYGVHKSTIYLILNGRNWGHLTKHILRGDMKEGTCP